MPAGRVEKAVVSMEHKKSIYRTAAKGAAALTLAVIAVETVTYTFSFLVSGLVKKDIFNLIEGTKTTLGIDSVWVLIALNIGVPLLINCVKQINSGLAVKLETRLKENVKSDLLKDVLSVRVGGKLNKSEGELISLFRNECEDISVYFMEFYRQTSTIVLCAAILIVMLCINPVFTIVSLCPTALMVLALRFFHGRITNNRMAARKRTSELTEYMESVFGNIEYFKMTCREEKIFELFREKCKRRRSSEVKDRVLDKALGSVSENSANFTLGIVLLISIPLLKQGRLTVGEMVMFEYYYAFLTSLPDAIGALIKRHKQTRVSADRLYEVHEASGSEGGRAKGPEAGDAVYEAGELEILLPGEKKMIRAGRGQVVLLGKENEEEKSVLLQQLFRLCSDRIRDIRCVYVPREPVLFDASICENICMGEPFDRDKFMTVIKQADLLEDIESFEEGMHKNAGKRGMAVSGGQRKRIAIARALYGDAGILFLNGLTDQVDRKTEENMVRSILGEFKGIIFLAAATDSAVRLMDGRQVIGNCRKEGMNLRRKDYDRANI